MVKWVLPNAGSAVVPSEERFFDASAREDHAHPARRIRKETAGNRRSHRFDWGVAVTGEQHARTLLTDDSQFEHWLQTGCTVQTTHGRCANSSPWGGGVLDLPVRTRWFLSVQVQQSLWHWFISLYSSKATRDCLWTALALFGQVIDGRWDRILIGWRERAGCRLHP